MSKKRKLRFKEIKGFPGYFVGTDGSVWTARARINKPKRCGWYPSSGSKWRLLSQGRNTSGYYRVTLRCGRKKAAENVHRLVLLAFRGMPPSGHEGAHEDGNQLNNKLDNLIWKTPAENNVDRIRDGRGRGENNHKSKLTEEMVKAIRNAKLSGERYCNIARRLGLNTGTVWKVANGWSWKHVPMCGDQS